MGIGKTLVESTMEIEDCNWETIKEIYSEDNHQWMLKLVGKGMMKIEYLHSSKYLPRR